MWADSTQHVWQVRLDPRHTAALKHGGSRDHGNLERLLSRPHRLIFPNYVKVTHENKNRVLRALSPDDLKEVRCDNPDIHVQGKNDDRIVLTQPKTLKNGKTSGSKKHITNVHAKDIFGDDWRNKLPIMRLHDRLDLLLEISSFDSLLWEEILRQVRRKNLKEAIYLPDPECLVLILRDEP